MHFVLVPGLWLDGAAWAATAVALEQLGHSVEALTLPGQGDGRSGATYDDQVAAVVAAVDRAPDRPHVVGHSAASALAWVAADARRDLVAGVVLVGGFPVAGGETYAAFFPCEDGVMPFPGWEPFAGPDTADLDEAARERIAASTVPVPEAVAHGRVRLSDERRFEVPVLMVCPEFSPDQARGWLEAGESPELASARHLTMVDLDSGHWPMFSCPERLATVLADRAGDPAAPAAPA